jgi:PAS domain S-box-containing protein
MSGTIESQPECAGRPRRDGEADPSLPSVLLDHLPFAAMIIRSGTREVLAANAAATAAGAVPGSRCYRSLRGLDEPCRWCGARKAWTAGRATQVQYTHAGRYWSSHWIPVEGGRLLHFAVDQGAAGTDTDLSGAGDLLRRLGEREAALLEAARIAELGYYELDLDTGTLRWSDEVFRIHDMDPAAGAPRRAAYAPFVHPEDATLVAAAFEESTTSGRPLDLEYRIITRTGEIRHVRSASHLRHAAGGSRVFAGVLQDVTARARTLRELRDSEALFRALSDLSPLGVTIVCGDRIVYANPAAAGILGRSQSEVERMTVQEVVARFAAADRGIVAEHYAQTLSGARAAAAYRVTLERDDGPRTLAIHSVRITLGGEPAVLANILDVTEARTAELALERERARLVEADKMATLGVLTASVAHDVAGPANTILETAGLLEETLTGAALPDEAQLRGRVQAWLSRIRVAAGRVVHITRGLKDFYARQDFAAEPLEVNAVVAAAIAAADGFVRAATSDLRVSLAPGLPAVIGDAQKLEQVIVNLLQNACQALRSPKESISIATGVAADPPGVEVRITDGGVGIASAEIAKISEPFYTTRRGQGGTGVGLTLARLIVGRLGGRLAIESAQGTGTTVRILLPPAGPAQP